MYQAQSSNAKYIDLARAKSEAPFNIYSLLKQNVKSCNANGEGNENGEKTKIGLISKKNNFAHAAHFRCTFLCRCFARPERKTSRSFLVTRFMEEMSFMFLFTFLPPSLIFTQVAASISHFLTAATKFHVVPATKNVSFVFSISLYFFSR